MGGVGIGKAGSRVMFESQSAGARTQPEGNGVVNAHVHQFVHKCFSLQAVGTRHQDRCPDHDIALPGDTATDASPVVGGKKLYHLGRIFSFTAHENTLVGDKDIVEEQPSLGNPRFRDFHIRSVFQFTPVAGMPGLHYSQTLDVPWHYTSYGIIFIRLLVYTARQQEYLLGRGRTANHQLGPTDDDAVFTHFHHMQVGIRIALLGG